MPTGYTAAIINDKAPVGTKGFAIQCLRAMGVAILMRDDPGDVQVPKQFEPDTSYHDRALVTAKEELDKWLKTSLAERIMLIRDQMDRNIRSALNSVAQNAEEDRRFHAVLQDILDWNVDAELTGYKNFMLEQLTISINYSTWGEDEVKRINSKDIDTYLAEQEESLRRNIAYHEKAIVEEIERTAKRNAWLKLAWEAIERLPEKSDWEAEDDCPPEQAAAFLPIPRQEA